MNTYYISDTHFCHFNIITYCSRPFNDTLTMNKHIIEMWNSIITPEDRVIFGGDFAFAAFSVQKEIFECLNGKEILCIKGNHDRGKKTLLKLGFKEVYDRYENDSVIIRHDPFDFTEEELNSNKICLFGHVHTEYHKWLKPNSFCICVEPLNYIPRTLEQLKELYAPIIEKKARTV